MQPAGLDALDWLGLGDRLRQLGAPIDRLFGREVHSGRIVLDVRYQALRAAQSRARGASRGAVQCPVRCGEGGCCIAIETGAKIEASIGQPDGVRC